MTHTCWNFSSYPHFRNCSFLTIHRIFRLKTTLGKHPFHISYQLGPILILIAPAYWRLYSVDFPDPVFFRVSPFLSTTLTTFRYNINPYPWIFWVRHVWNHIQMMQCRAPDSVRKLRSVTVPRFGFFHDSRIRVYINWWFSWPNSFFVRFEPSKKFVLDKFNIGTAH